MQAALGRTRQSIKKALMDQKLLAGVGNIYANEALFAAGIDPSREAVRLSGAEWEGLHRELQRILSVAVAGRGSTVRDYRTGTGGKGRVPALPAGVRTRRRALRPVRHDAGRHPRT